MKVATMYVGQTIYDMNHEPLTVTKICNENTPFIIATYGNGEVWIWESQLHWYQN